MNNNTLDIFNKMLRTASPNNCNFLGQSMINDLVLDYLDSRHKLMGYFKSYKPEIIFPIAYEIYDEVRQDVKQNHPDIRDYINLDLNNNDDFLAEIDDLVNVDALFKMYRPDNTQGFNLNNTVSLSTILSVMQTVAAVISVILQIYYCNMGTRDKNQPVQLSEVKTPDLNEEDLNDDVLSQVLEKIQSTDTKIQHKNYNTMVNWITKYFDNERK